MIEPQRIHQYIAHHIYLRLLGSLACRGAGTLVSGSEEQVRQSVDHQTVDFLGHVYVERTGAGYKMRERQSLLLCHDGSRHGRSKVVHHNHGIGLVLAQILLETRHHLTRQLVQILAVNAEIHLRPRHLQVLEKRRFQCRVVLASCIDKMMTYVLATVTSTVYGPYDRSQFYEIGPCARYNTYFHYPFTLL